MNILVALALVVSGLLDMKTTNSALERGATERNPLWQWLQSKLGSKWGYAKMATHLGLAWVVLGSDSLLTLTVGTFLAAIVAGLAYRNTKRAR